ncbi:MAG: regulatory protein RecX [Anaerostipes sp.]|jgi:regulatory protein|uniref:regulatory protein RecX n=1 Tax=Anaerostipes TaxID=207244 RepID=UPI001C019B38|nr:regulatory protein RecX [Anaerostipes hadrus]MBT9903182.1 regulatory protein RecX [Anaerostipes hadrus]
MIITKLDKVGTKQVRLFFDEEKYCLLYYNEVRRLGFHEKDEVGQQEFEELNKLLLHRAKLKAMSLLKYQDRTRKELKDRLMRVEFPEFITEGAIAYVESFGYINDEEYVRRYMEYKAGTKSRIQIKMDLRKKGIGTEILERIFDEYEYEEDDVLEEQVQKRIRQKGSVTKENFQKYYGYFARKGFNSVKIIDLLRKYCED